MYVAKYSCEIIHLFGSKIRDGEFRTELKTTPSEHTLLPVTCWLSYFYVLFSIAQTEAWALHA
jgi:hypothetical protein